MQTLLRLIVASRPAHHFFQLDQLCLRLGQRTLPRLSDDLRLHRLAARILLRFSIARLSVLLPWNDKFLLLALILRKAGKAICLSSFTPFSCPNFVFELATLLTFGMLEAAVRVETRVVTAHDLGMRKFAVWRRAVPTICARLLVGMAVLTVLVRAIRVELAFCLVFVGIPLRWARMSGAAFVIRACRPVRAGIRHVYRHVGWSGRRLMCKLASRIRTAEVETAHGGKLAALLSPVDIHATRFTPRKRTFGHFAVHSV